MKRARTIYLDLIRIFACLMVIMMHAPVPGERAMAHSAFLVIDSYLTASCVPLFFMVSGALLLPAKSDVSAKMFLKKRSGKIVGPTLCFSLFYIVLNIRDFSGEFKDLIHSVLSIPFSAQGHGILWFMYTLSGLYLLVPIVSSWLQRATKRDIEFYLAIWFITTLYPYIGLLLQINTGDTGILYYFTGYAGYFLLGHYAVKYGFSLKLLLPLFVFMLPLPLLNKVCGWDLDFYSAFWYLSAPVVIMTCTWFALFKRLFEKRTVAVLFERNIAIVSNLSFGIYLIHIFVMRTLLYNWSFIQNIQNYYVQTLLIVVFTFVGSLIGCLVIAQLPLSQYVIGYAMRKGK